MGLILKEDNSNGEPEDLAAMIDKIFKQGSGHLVIDLDAAEEGMRFTTANSTDCGALGACAQPTEFIDEDDENDLPPEYYEDDDDDDDDDYDYEEDDYDDDDEDEED